MQLHPSAPFGAPDLSLTLRPCFGIWTTACKQHTFCRLLRAIPVPPASIAACPRRCSFPACATRPYLRDDPTCATSLPARRTYLRVEPTCASCESACQSLCPPASITACPRRCSFPACATRPDLRDEPTCASSLPARRAGLPACLHARACARGENVVNLRRTLKFFRRTCNSVAAA